MLSPNLLQVRLHNSAPQVLSSITEDFLRCSIMYIDFVVNKIRNSIFCSLRNCSRHRPSRRIIDRRDDPSIPMCGLRKNSNQIDPPTLEWLYKWVCHQLTVFPLLMNSLALYYLAVWASRNKSSHIRFQRRPPASSLNRIGDTRIQEVSKLTMQLLHEVSTKYWFDVGCRYPILELPKQCLIDIHAKIIRKFRNSLAHRKILR